MDRRAVEEYIKEKQKVTIPEIQVKFSLSYKEVRKLFLALEQEQTLTVGEDAYFLYKAIEKTKAKQVEVTPTVEQDSLETRKAFLEQRRLELLKRIEATWQDDDDEEDEEDDESPDTSPSDFRQKRMLETIANVCGLQGKFILKEGVYVCETDVTYPDDTEIKFKLFYTDNVTLSDFGGTLKYIAGHYRFEDEELQNRLKAILQDYSIKIVPRTKELIIHIHDKNSAWITFLWFFSAIERIINIRLDSLLVEISQELKKRCKEELKKIIFEQKATYTQAKKYARTLLDEANISKTEEEKIVYQNVLSTLEQITELGYEQFKREFIEEE